MSDRCRAVLDCYGGGMLNIAQKRYVCILHVEHDGPHVGGLVFADEIRLFDGTPEEKDDEMARQDP